MKRVYVDAYPAVSYSSGMLGGKNQVTENGDTVLVRFQRRFFYDLTTSSDLRPEPAGLTLGRPLVTDDDLHGQIIHAVLDILRHIRNDRIPTEVRIRFAKKPEGKTRMIWHKSGAATCVLSKKAVAELLRVLANIGCPSIGFDIHEIARQVNDDSKVISKAWHAHYVSEDGWAGNGSPRLCALFTLLDFLQSYKVADISPSEEDGNSLEQ